MTSPPTSSVDLFAEDALDDPYPSYADLRALGPVVHLEAHDLWALTHYDAVREALQNWPDFTSARGVALNPTTNAGLRGNVLASDPPRHGQLRAVLAEQLTPRRLRERRDQAHDTARALVGAAIDRGSFDAVADLTAPLSSAVLADLLGVPDEIRPELSGWAEASFDAFGPPDERAERGRDRRAAMIAWISRVRRDDLAPGSAGRAIVGAGEAGDMDPAACRSLLAALISAGIDTSGHALSHMILMFARNPDQWDLVRQEPSTASRSCLDEAVRHDSPIRGFTRVTTAAVRVGGVTLPPDQRVLMLFGAANRDERHYVRPDHFDVTRPSDHLGFGRGIHTCVGRGLAHLEAEALLTALGSRVRRFHLDGPPTPHRSTMLRGLSALPIDELDLI